MTANWTNDAAIEQWNSSATREALDATAADGDFVKRHLVNPVLLRMLGDVRGRRVLDAGCGNGYLSRILAERGARVVGVEPTEVMSAYAADQERRLQQGIRYLRADLARLPGPTDIGGTFDAVVCSMVLMSIPDWKPAMRSCVRALRPAGRFVFALVHPAFEQLLAGWRDHGEYRLHRYLQEYEIPGPAATDFHRPVSAYLNEVAALGCRVLEVAEPGLDPALAAEAAATMPGIEALVDIPNFLMVAAETSAF